MERSLFELISAISFLVHGGALYPYVDLFIGSQLHQLFVETTSNHLCKIHFENSR